MGDFFVYGNIVDIYQKKIFYGSLKVVQGVIAEIRDLGNEDLTLPYILPGFIDAHVHIESSMLVPSEFARVAVVHGTVATVSDPHEIANVLGLEGVRYMIKNNKQTIYPIFFGAPSCVPATTYETAGGAISLQDIMELFEKEDLKYLSEMMNFPGVIHHDKNVIEKIEAAKKFKKPIDGHAPGLSGEDIRKYIQEGISTDHECSTLNEALEKLKLGMKILIREGSAAKNFEALKTLIKSHPDQLMFCTDDIHPNDLLEGHINLFVKRALKVGYDFFDVLRIASLNPIKQYGLDIGALQPGDRADFIIIDSLSSFQVLETYIHGIKVAEKGHCLLPEVPVEVVNNFNCSPIQPEQLAYEPKSEILSIIKIIPNEIITEKMVLTQDEYKRKGLPSVQEDILKIVVVNRYNKAPPAIAYIHGFGIKQGGFASSVAHDSHNIIAVGVDDNSICRAINGIISSKGGLSVSYENEVLVMPLPVAGLMSDKPAKEVIAQYSQIQALVKKLGTQLEDPFMTLSFMALLVIPSLKLSDKGLFDGDKFEFVN